MNSIYFKLNEQIDQNKFVQKIQTLIFKQENLNNKFLKIEIVEISYENNDIIPKLEFKPEQ